MGESFSPSSMLPAWRGCHRCPVHATGVKLDGPIVRMESV
jgi:hypothetical protein